MAAPADVTKDLDAAGTKALEQLRVEHNNVVAALRIIAAKLDLDAGVTDVNYFALSLDNAIVTAPKKIV